MKRTEQQRFFGVAAGLSGFSPLFLSHLPSNHLSVRRRPPDGHSVCSVPKVSGVPVRHECAHNVEGTPEVPTKKTERVMFMSFQVLGLWFRSLLSIVFLAGGIALLSLWYANREHIIREPFPADGRQTEQTSVVSWQFGFNRETAFLLGGVALLGWSLGGGWMFSSLLLRRPGRNEPHAEKGHSTQMGQRPNGSELNVTLYGPADGDPVVFVHGWGLDSNEWVYAKREFGTYRLITWDLPGLGRSTRPANRDWSLESLAADLDAVIEVADGRPVALVGHSIGTMIILTYCKLFPGKLGTRVSSLVLAHGTYTNPVKTTSLAGLYAALQKPVLEPLCHLMVWLSPLVRVLNWMSYLNGSAHRSTSRSSFSGRETRGQLSFITRYYCIAPPDVVGRGMLAMFRYDATSVLGSIPIPTLILAGDKDSTCIPDASRYMAEHIRNAELIVLQDAKHCGLFEHHEQFHEAIVGFLAAHPAPIMANKPAEPAASAPTGQASPMLSHKGS